MHSSRYTRVMICGTRLQWLRNERLPLCTKERSSQLVLLAELYSDARGRVPSSPSIELRLSSVHVPRIGSRFLEPARLSRDRNINLAYPPELA